MIDVTLIGDTISKISLRLSRSASNRLRSCLDELLPPFIRDSRFFMSFPMRLVFREKAELFMDFKSRAPGMAPKEMAELYEQVQSVSVQRDTDINRACLDKIDRSILGKTVLDAGCGRGYLAGRLAERYTVTGVDFVLGPDLSRRHPRVDFCKGHIEMLPFKAASFDTVICAHTLEHVVQIEPVLRELRRVARCRLIIIVPKQRPYKYTFDLHLQFFPQPYSLLQAVGSQHQAKCVEVDGDLFLLEDCKR
ncbi:Methyltransferase domain-containing protein [Geodermatophilus siccatus]|uniref:Methyltransferase domain-containing protein n=1 Tax=Geodermatophilus siccatus TaxID=1137991 RepID=A0A1G9QF03_9ACTN|nr:class I SAM-dependent methyltransferase [Geodermatophilus siccatus]SDM09470.1 Methyltransferase domain-containing protein [Geodermatophilus siccatus]